MKTIAFDVMGNDNGVRPAVEATLEFLKNNLDYYFILVGDGDEINKYIKDNERIKIMDIKNTIDADSKVLESRKSNNSMGEAIRLVKEGKADAVLSSGNSGAYLMQLILILKRLKNIKRPAFMPVFPTIKQNKKFIMLDVGANVTATDQMLVEWAQMGNIFSNIVLGIESPRVAILNIGTENNKGYESHQSANEKLKAMSNINYVGFFEPRELLNGEVDVIVCDGYGGNLVLKTLEGSVLGLLKLLKENIMSHFRYKLGALLVRGAFNNVKKQIDYRNVGAAWVLGINGLAMKAHGSSKEKEFLGALNQIRDALDQDFWNKFKEAIE